MTVAVPLETADEAGVVESFLGTLVVLPLLEIAVELLPVVLLALVFMLDRGIGLSSFRARRRFINWSFDSRRPRGIHTGSYTMRLKVPPVKI